MRTDALFHRLFRDLPETFFELLNLPPEEARHYRLDAVELKETALRIDGVFLPVGTEIRPVWFVEVQFYANPRIYANLFAKVFHYLHGNFPVSCWRAVVVFPGRGLEPPGNDCFRLLLESEMVHRIYLDELPLRKDASLGYEILRLVSLSEEDAARRGPELVVRALRDDQPDSLRRAMVEWIETLFVLKFPLLSRTELEAMLKLDDIRRSRVWQEAWQEGQSEGRQEGRQEGIMQAAARLLARGMTVEEVADLLLLPIEQLRQVEGAESEAKPED